MFKYKNLVLLIMVWAASPVYSQFSLNGQYILRGEYRHGFNRPISQNDDPAQFLAHRARLQAQYQSERLHMFVSVQDIRTWGSTPQANTSDAFLSVYEAWGEYKFTPHLSAKLGRQELNYDGSRFLGSLDWFLQARSHDFALVKWEKDGRKLHVGAGYNQDGQTLANHDFFTPNQYKSALMARYESFNTPLQYSLLAWAETRQRLISAEGTLVTDGTHNRQTFGAPTLRYALGGNTEISGYYYHQLGQDVQRRSINAYNANLQLLQRIPLDSVSGSQLRLVAGAELISGTDQNTQSDKNHSYSLQYGTNHLFNGYMDLFYVGGAHENSVGLNDYYVKARYDINPRFFVQGDYHRFDANAQVVDATGADMQNNLGHEIDITAGYVLNPEFSVQAGYSHFFATDTWRRLHANLNMHDTQNWAYLMLIFRPGNPNKFIGPKL
ncbi:MAG: alginate export family protein [Weeksellaceae bacterium]|nr:alginate export family protein [Weeksellaceae bacterium]